jgi:ABC-type multidrug transport system fused ATPase/permease subunit
MSLSIGSGGLRMGPGRALDSFAEKVDGQAFDPRIVLRLLAYVRPFWRRMALALVLMLVATVLTLVTPYLIKVAIDGPIARGDVGALTRVAGAMAAALAGLFLASAAQQYLLSWVGQRVLADMRSDLCPRDWSR